MRWCCLAPAGSLQPTTVGATFRELPTEVETSLKTSRGERTPAVADVRPLLDTPHASSAGSSACIHRVSSGESKKQITEEMIAAKAILPKTPP